MYCTFALIDTPSPQELEQKLSFTDVSRAHEKIAGRGVVNVLYHVLLGQLGSSKKIRSIIDGSRVIVHATADHFPH